MVGEGSENEASVQERFTVRMEENTKLGRLAVSRHRETIERLKLIDNIEHIELARDYGKTSEAGEKFTNDSQWVWSLIEAGVSKEMILKAWDIKDEKNRKADDQVRDMRDQR
ncbi:hypothetical protein HYZ05_01955 [Candidatus Daviesbacteria bacterium]|nr:hypothetical protein [Candidatus Daviesbacteria bacterium]